MLLSRLIALIINAHPEVLRHSARVRKRDVHRQKDLIVHDLPVLWAVKRHIRGSRHRTLVGHGVQTNQLLHDVNEPTSRSS